MGQCIKLPKSGGTVNVSWRVASTTILMTRVELMINGEIRESRAVKADEDSGNWSVNIEHSVWVAILVRAKYTQISRK